MAEVKLRCLVCGSTELESTADGYKCANCGAAINYTSSYMNHLALFDKVAVYVKNGDFARANRVIDELLKCSRTCPETYWYMLLIEYGIRYIDNECRVTIDNNTPIVLSENYKNALKFSGYYMEKFFKAKAKEFEQIRLGVAQEPTASNATAVTNTISAESLESILSTNASINVSNSVDTLSNTLIKDNSIAKEIDNADLADKKESNAKGITLDTADYVHKGHNHCEADDSFDALEVELVNSKKVESKIDSKVDSIIKDKYVKNIDLFSDDLETDIAGSKEAKANSDKADNILIDIINERATQKKKQNKVVAIILATICVLITIVNIIMLFVSREPVVSIIFFSLISSIAGIFLCGFLDKKGKTKIVPIVTFFITIASIIIVSIINMFNF